MKESTKQIYRSYDHDQMNFDILINAVNETKDLYGVVIECGTGKGVGTKMIIEALSNTETKFYSVDNYPLYKGGDINPYEGATHPLMHDGEFYRVTKDRTLEQLNRRAKAFHCHFVQINQDDIYFCKKTKDEVKLAFIDSEHSLEHVIKLAVHLTPKVVEGGMMVFDDVQCYDHSIVDEFMYHQGFDIAQVGDFKISYRRGP